MTKEIEPNQLRIDLNIAANDLDMEIIKQPGLFAYYAEMHHQAGRALKLAKLKASVFEAGIYAAEKDKALAKNIKITEADLQARIRLNEVWRRHQEACIDLEAQEEQLKSIMDALRQKKDMLITFSSNKRHEITSGFNLGGRVPQGHEGQKSSNAAIPLVGAG